MMKKVLIISYYCTPRKGIGSVRIKGLLKYLPEYGWEPTVLTAKLPYHLKDYAILETEYPGNISEIVKRKIHFNPTKGFQEQLGIPLAMREGRSSFTRKIMTALKEILCFPDEQRLWLKYGIQMGETILKNETYDVIFSSSGPYTSHLIAKFLKKKNDIPWVADFRDLWTQNHYYPYSRIRKYFERKLEQTTLQYADCLVTVSEPLADELQENHPGKKIFCITNGFDEEELLTGETDKDFLITYTGQLYLGKQDAWMLFKVIRDLIDKGRIDHKRIKIFFYGWKQYWLENEIKQYHLDQIVFQKGFVDRKIVLKVQRKSQLLLLLNWENEKGKGVYTGKIFEYLAAQRPILALGGPKDNVVSQLLKETKAGYYLFNEENTKNTLLKLYKEYLENREVKYNGILSKILQYSHRNMAKKFTEVFNALSCELSEKN